MAKIEGIPTVMLAIRLVITEQEARALDAMAGYGDDAFIKIFYEHLGKSYMQKHEDGLRLFLKSIRELMPLQLWRTDKAREAFNPVVPPMGQFEMASK